MPFPAPWRARQRRLGVGVGSPMPESVDKAFNRGLRSGVVKPHLRDEWTDLAIPTLGAAAYALVAWWLWP